MVYNLLRDLKDFPLKKEALNFTTYIFCLNVFYAFIPEILFETGSLVLFENQRETSR